MIKIGNIISFNEELVNHIEKPYINYISNIEDKNIDYSMPTLFIGWNNVKQIYDNINILNKEIKKNNLYWEYSFDENKQDHVNGVDLFSNQIPFFYFQERYNYHIIDPIFQKIYNVKDCINQIKLPINKVYIDKNIIYVLSGKDIYGINIDFLDFFDIDKQQIIDHLTFLSDKCVNDFNNTIYKKYANVFYDFPFLKRYIITII